MEVEEENNANVNLKRQRVPLSDSEDNVLSPSEGNDGQKRRRLEAAGQENRSPKPSSSGRLAELDTKPDTPMVPSVRSRVHQLTQRREGGAPLAQRCLSDPGTNSPSLIIHEKGFREHILARGEFNQRMERFKVFQAGPASAPSPGRASPRTCSNFVSAIQQKLHGTPVPSSNQASRFRQERAEELSQLHFQPISENAWLKRSSSDPSLSQIDDDTEMKDGSFTGASTSCAEKQSSDGTGEMAPSDFEAPAELDNSREVGQLNTGWKEQNPCPGDEVREEDGNEEMQPRTQQPQSQTVLKLSFSEDQKVPFSDDQSELPTSDEQSSLDSTLEEESDMAETVEVSIVTEEMFSYEERDGSSCSEGALEPSTDEELRSWRYPLDKEKSIVAGEQEEDVCVKEEEEELDSSRVEKGKRGCVADHSEPADIQDSDCYLGDVSAETTSSSEMQEDEKPRTEESQSCFNDSVMHQFNPSGDIETIEFCGGLHEGADTEDDDISIIKPNQKDTEGCSQHSNEIQNTVGIEEDNMDLELDRSGSEKQAEASPPAAVAQTLTETQTGYTVLKINTKHAAKCQAESSDTDGMDRAPSPTEVQEPDHLLENEQRERGAVDERQGVVDGLRGGTHKAQGGERLKKVTFILEPELINDSTLSEANTSTESRAETMSDISHDETNTSEIIDQMFEEVLEYAGRMDEERGGDEGTEEHDSGIGVCPGDKDKMEGEEEGESKGEDASRKLESSRDELTFPPSGILSPLSKSVEAVVTPLRLAASQESNPASLLSTPEETTTTPVAESAPLYSIDAYRTQRQSNLPAIQSVTPGVQRRAPEKSQLQPSVNIKEKITALSEEAGKLQTVINQTLQALSCCTDEEHGRGSLEEAEAEKLLLVSCEKRSALLAEVARLREERSAESGEDSEYVSQQACRGTVSITKIQLPLKVEFVCSSHKRTGRPSHYFFVLIRYGPCNIVATPLATAADAENGDTISFPTSVTLKDIRSSFEIDVEVYSLSHTGSNCSVDRTTTKSRVTPRKLLNTITRSSNSLTSGALPALNTRRSSNFFLVGSHQITLDSLGHSKFPLDKMKLEGKIRRLLGNEFQEKVPFLSPLEGNIYLQLDSESHSNVQHQGFLTMFELISGFGVWHRRYFVLVGCNMYHWNHPNDNETKEAEGSISLTSAHSRCVRLVKRDSCARPFTFELVSSVPQQQDAIAKCWFSADSKQERLDWMEKLNQALLDFQHVEPNVSSPNRESGVQLVQHWEPEGEHPVTPSLSQQTISAVHGENNPQWKQILCGS